MSKTSIGDYSLNDLKVLAPHIPGIGNFINRLLADSYEDFVEALRIDIDEIVSKLQENPELLSEDGEDRLTSEIKRSLTHMGYKATHDEKNWRTFRFGGQRSKKPFVDRRSKNT
ncbi:hypothetical protein [Pseudomonas aeruginosa]|uniref:hypothetical protein n=1 Tax=Pseudomonas aeruginosa TaxID=287 RepID=UPI001267D1C0|nr:hypothetical protein [Pseudomonas aeruginosa]